MLYMIYQANLVAKRHYMHSYAFFESHNEKSILELTRIQFHMSILSFPFHFHKNYYYKVKHNFNTKSRDSSIILLIIIVVV